MTERQAAEVLGEGIASLAQHVAEIDHLGVPTSFQRAAHLAACVAIAESLMPAAVALMRADGASWADVGEALGISRQAAHARFGGL